MPSSGQAPRGRLRSRFRRRRRLASSSPRWCCALAFLIASTPARNSDLWLHLASGRLLAQDQMFAWDRPFFFHYRGRFLGQPYLAERSFPVRLASAWRRHGSGCRQSRTRDDGGGPVLLFSPPRSGDGIFPLLLAAARFGAGTVAVAADNLAVAARRVADSLSSGTSLSAWKESRPRERGGSDGCCCRCSLCGPTSTAGFSSVPFWLVCTP